ncbi:MAG: glycoside hydrolase family 3 N-terminal domain-containing protein [Lachnospiraceae bacterium]|nr:glycoside hydrolase family 3 N-terminal domain-containing protein [Lachnospiraceae bacterium]MDD3615814.1 glycoside hydrolase family 3 N-terminal domain-containing protein [Lachnospiraceae bacterium]
MKKVERTFSGVTSTKVSERELMHRETARKAAAEGMVLLKNENLLPLEKGTKLALYGSGASKTIKGGTGSGDVNERSSVTVLEGLENSGFIITTKDWLTDYDKTYQQARIDWRDDLLKQGEGQGLNEFFGIVSSHPFQIPHTRPVEEADVEKSETKTAMYVVSRIAGEGADRVKEKGDYYLTDEEMTDLAFICAHYENVILVVNTGAQIDLSYVKDMSSIKSIIYMVQAGMEGGNALADLVCGYVTPSAKLTDTWAWKYEQYPSAETFSHNNGDVTKEYYHDSIYVGYRYFDSFGIQPQYEFGFGLSYTDFQILPGKAPVSVDDKKQIITVNASVKNIGDKFSGKEVVQIYVSCPQEGLAKEYRRLCGFAKTAVLKPGEETNVSITFPVKAIASYDEQKGAWVVEEGTYGLWLGNSSRNLQLCGGIKTQGGILEENKHICPLQEELEEIVRPQEAALAFEKEWKEELNEKSLPVMSLQVEKESKATHKECMAEQMAKELVEKLEDDELIYMVIGEISKGQGNEDVEGVALGSAGISVPGAAGETSSVLEEKYGVPGISMADGPAGLRLKKSYPVDKETGSLIPEDPFAAFEGGFFVEPKTYENADIYYQYCTAIPVGALLAQSWDINLIEEIGYMVGKEMQEFHVAWWLAPGMNIHRNPLCGRNFEYYSEDPLVSGKIAAAMTRGVQSENGVGTTIKHFACNNSEDNRMGVDDIVSERTLRELYLRGFEIAVKESQPMAIMTSYNLINGVHSANNRDICTVAAREEWGFEGIIMTDWTTTFPLGGSESYKCPAAGNDLIMPGYQGDIDNIKEALASGILNREDLKACVARMLTIIYQSNGFEDAVPYKKSL